MMLLKMQGLSLDSGHKKSQTLNKKFMYKKKIYMAPSLEW